MPPTGAVRRSKPKRRRTTRGPQGLLAPASSPQRPTSPPVAPRTSAPAFGPISGQTKPFARSQRKSRAKSRQGRRRLPNDPLLRRPPLIPPGQLTAGQRQAIVRNGRAALEVARNQGGHRSIREYYDQASPADRKVIRYLAEVAKVEQEQRAPSLPTPVEYHSPPRRSGVERFATAAYNDAFAQITSGAGAGLRGPINLARSVVFETPKAYIEDPGKALSADAQFALDTAAGLVKAPFAVAHGQGGEIVKGLGESYSRRYGPALRGDFPAYRQVVKTEGGLPTLLDATLVAAIPAKGLGVLARAGALGRGAERFVTRPRPEIRESPGRVIRQPHDETAKAAPNVARVALQRRRDRARARQAERLDVKRRRGAAGEDAAQGTRRLTRPPKPRLSGRELQQRRAGFERLVAAGARVVRDERGRLDRVEVPDRVPAATRERIDASLRAAGFATRRGRGRTIYYARREVTHRERVAGVPTGRIRERMAQRRDPAGLKGIAISSLRQMGAEERREFTRTVKGLNPHERNALMYGTVGLAALDDPVRAVAHLERRRAQILAERGAKRMTRFQADEIRKIDRLLKHADEAFTPKLRVAVESVREQIRRAERRNPTLVQRQRVEARYGPQAHFLGIERREGESTSSFVRRVREAAEREGLGTPAFVPSEEFAGQRYSSYAVGGTRAPSAPKRRTYALQRRGTQRTDPEIVFEGVQRNIKAQHTANLVGDVYERHAHPELRNLTIGQLKRAVEREGLDPGQVAFWFPGKYRDALRGLGGNLEGHISDVADDLGNLGRDVHDAVRGSVITVDRLDDLDQLPDDFKQARGTVVPRSVHNEVFATTKGDTAAGRVAERIKSLQSRAVLGALNFNWLITDTLANGFMTWLGGNVGPKTFLQSQGWWRGLEPAAKRSLGAQLDVGRMRSQTYIPHMGATVNTGWVNKWRALRSTPVGSTAKPLTKMLSALMRAQPVRRGIDTFLELENKVANDPFRRAVAYQLLRKEAFQRIDQRMGVMTGQIHRLVGLMGKPPHAQMRALLHEPGMIEDIARGVDEILGDFHSFTAIERRTVGRFLFFYPYARFATRLAFYTLPTQHPLKLAIGARIGQMTEREQRELLGVPENQKEELRGLMFGRVFYKDPSSPTGISEQNIRTANPLGNPLTESEGTESIWGLLAPWMQWAVSQIEKRDVFRGRPWNLHGESTGPYDQPDLGPLWSNVGTRARILTRQLLELPVVTREISKHLLPGEQSDESLPGFPVPMRYKTPERQVAADRRRAQDEAEPFPEQLLRSQARLFVGEPSDILGQIERRQQSLGLPRPAPNLARHRSSAHAVTIGHGSSGLSPRVEDALIRAAGSGARSGLSPRVARALVRASGD